MLRVSKLAHAGTARNRWTMPEKMAGTAGWEVSGMSPDDNPPSRVDADSWDPYEIWLKRVKQPRDRQFPQSPRNAGAQMQVGTRDDRRVTESHGLLPGVT
jgi:hypothetical protein